MKHCLICKLSDQDDAVPTCPACGEASWSVTVATPGLITSETPSADEVVVTDEATVEKTTKKRSKK